MEINVEEVGPQNPSIGIASSSSSSSSPGKFVCICVQDVDFKYEWYVFDVSDDIQHNQPPPPPKYMNRLSRFHDDDDSGVVNLFPKVTANMDLILGWSILGSKMLYTVNNWTGYRRGRSAWKESNRVNRIDLTTPMAEWERLPRMPNQIAFSAHIFILGGMFYCLGGFLEWDSLLNMEYDKLFLSFNGVHDELPPPPCLDIDKSFSASKPSPFTTPTDLERPSPWAMAYDPSVNAWESLPDPPQIPHTVDRIFSAAGEVPIPFIVVGSPEDRALLIYHVNTKKWERRVFEICPKFSPYMFRGPALAVNGKLYWYSVHGLCLAGYDLITNIWFEGNIPIHDCGEDFGVLENDTPPRLAHIGGDEFCLLWVSVLLHHPMTISESKDDCISRLHCMKIQVTTGNLDSDSKIFPLEVSILSCQSYLVPGLKFFRGGLVV